MRTSPFFFVARGRSARANLGTKIMKKNKNFSKQCLQTLDIIPEKVYNKGTKEMEAEKYGKDYESLRNYG